MHELRAGVEAFMHRYTSRKNSRLQNWEDFSFHFGIRHGRRREFRNLVRVRLVLAQVLVLVSGFTYCDQF
jgi:hypothetical protein